MCGWALLGGFAQLNQPESEILEILDPVTPIDEALVVSNCNGETSDFVAFWADVATETHCSQPSNGSRSRP
jgi:hypothetical protein